MPVSDNFTNVPAAAFGPTRYELFYTNFPVNFYTLSIGDGPRSGTSCYVNGNCSNGVCQYDFENNTADSRCLSLLPGSRFNGENLTVTLGASNYVGSGFVGPISIGEFFIVMYL